jgi:hypothetical protein
MTCPKCGLQNVPPAEYCKCGLRLAGFKTTPTPVWTGISLASTLAVEAAMVSAIRSIPGSDLGFIGIGVITAGVALVGILINIIAAYHAHKRGEPWGGRFAVLGIVVWGATIAVCHYYR